jgi:coproporphyrinogen III oxidase-like Fe-S oxidoreductase
MATLYFHIPFCKRICSYCDFYKVGAIELLPRVVEQMHKELDERSNFLEDRAISSIYFGGGTPSLLPPEDIESLIAHARRLFDCSAVSEITIEANPDDGLGAAFYENIAKMFGNREPSSLNGQELSAFVKAYIPAGSFDPDNENMPF